MKNENQRKPDYLFEVSWEVCNKVGGIHTVIATKALTLADELKNNHILIGPDVWRHTTVNPEFIEDKQLFKGWREKAAAEGLRIKIGRWNITGKPIAILVDFTTFMPQRDDIFKKFWEDYRLDSITGQWDYVEASLFGYASGKVIESFYRFFLSRGHQVIAHFHEWMTGAGLLYLKSNLPHVATAFTTHATVLGRSIAGNNLPLYDNMEKYNPEAKARDFNIESKHSMEKLSAQNADVFTTVSELTARECKAFLGKEVNEVTPNGFEPNFLPSDEEEFKLRKVEARVKFYEVAEALVGYDIPKDSLLVGISGRYEFRNKGIDLFLDSLGRLNHEETLQKNIVAFILVPGAHQGARKDVFHNLMDKTGENPIPVGNTLLTHYLSDPEYDPILKKATELGLNNAPDNKVKLFFVPCYLDGNDGIFNKTYYDMLIGLDLSVFPSYYEPWGYTPLESLAFRIPTITTTLAGFGLWVNTHEASAHPGIEVIERTDSNDEEVVNHLVEKMKNFSNLSRQEMEPLKQNASDVSNIALWKNLIEHYHNAYDFALEQIIVRSQQLDDHVSMEPIPVIEKRPEILKPIWTRIMVQKNLPEKLAALEELARNYWWCWNQDAIELFSNIDPDLWKEAMKSPIALLEKLPLKLYKELERNAAFLKKMEDVHARFKTYMAPKEHREGPRIAYFSMEYGIHSSLKIYSGGLGILAGDYLKEASDKNTDIVAVGLLYRYGYFHQQLSSTGQQIAALDTQDFSKIAVSPVRDSHGHQKVIKIALPGRNLSVRIWKAEVGRTDLYLLDTDFDENLPEDRSVTHQLYGGNLENRLKQELLLGVGGIRALKTLGIKADVYHCNEGHAAMIGLERINNLVNREKLSFPEALEVVRSSSLFTTHTPVPAGHDAFPENLLRTYIAHYPERMKISWDQLVNLGKVIPGNPNELFSMSYLATNLSQEVNGVSRLHGKVSREVFKDMWPGYFEEELHIGYVTNGVHYPTWTSPLWKHLSELSGVSSEIASNETPTLWNSIYDVPNTKIWEIRCSLKQSLIAYIKERLANPLVIKYENPKMVFDVKEKLRDDILTIGFARRFATYKRAALLFRDIDRISKIINNSEKPVQFLFAGKAHPNDKMGQDLIKRIIEISKMPQFQGKILFLQNYNMDLASHMVQGVDIWLNNPARPMEASGTSGQKAVMNGVLHFSVLDGWWCEGYKEGAGWALPEEQIYDNEDYQDELDAETIYTLLENEIVPAYYDVNKENIPEKWVGFIKKSIAEVASQFTTRRMLTDYENQYYHKLSERYTRMKANDFQLAKELAGWKKRMVRSWNDIEVISVKQFETNQENIVVGEKYCASVELDVIDLKPEEVGVELVVANPIDGNKTTIKYKQQFDLTSVHGSRAIYTIIMLPTEPGTFDAGIRIYAKHPELPNRMDFSLVRWI
ncbi:alpha-glucan family phosphorylase [Williamwhitmania taraxaci]|uniref:Phosphorylase / glycogen(Starch) synthase n=1 Tax=Williamwhitmania taraxaci TaxID=1640674 RepID=A0A1G6PJ37_9BACT|nr:alpha-glucan family phosphorylase [Williamwhitmania taraxaci]SDC79536.1 phosphorylase / glycogen(starch) synthase [Williamwhitmania taraxaci]